MGLKVLKVRLLLTPSDKVFIICIDLYSSNLTVTSIISQTVRVSAVQNQQISLIMQHYMRKHEIWL